MDRQILKDYIDACELVNETEREIARLKRKRRTIVTGNVKGSDPTFPYTEKHFPIYGMAYTYEDDKKIRYDERLLAQRKSNAEKVKQQVEEYMESIPMRMQRIIRYKYFQGLSWERVADRMGRKATGDSLRKELRRFLEEK